MAWDGDKNDYLNRMRDGNPRLVSRPSRTAGCCEACTFLRGLHAVWCPHYREPDAPRAESAGAALRPESYIAGGS